MYVRWETCRGKKESILADYCEELTHKGSAMAFANLIEILIHKKLLNENDLKEIFDDYSMTEG